MISEVEQVDGTVQRFEHDGSDLALEHIGRMQAHAIEARQLIDAGKPALARLMKVAEGVNSGQQRYIVDFLLGLYNGPRFPFDLTNLRAIDATLRSDCFTVLAMDAGACQQEVHRYFDNGGERFEAMAKRLGLNNE